LPNFEGRRQSVPGGKRRLTMRRGFSGPRSRAAPGWLAAAFALVMMGVALAFLV
jgi:hypothetical protein